MKKLHLAFLLYIASAGAYAIPLECYQDPKTDAVQCVDPKSVDEVDGIRIATLFTGGPKSITQTDFTVNVNCGTNVLHLKDKRGVSFAGGSGSLTPATRKLRDIVCSAVPKSPKRKKQ